MEDKRDQKVTVWTTAAEHRLLAQAAQAAGLPLSAFVRAAALAVARAQARREQRPHAE